MSAFKREHGKKRSWRELSRGSQALGESTLSQKPRESKLHNINTAERDEAQRTEKRHSACRVDI